MNLGEIASYCGLDFFFLMWEYTCVDYMNLVFLVQGLFLVWMLVVVGGNQSLHCILGGLLCSVAVTALSGSWSGGSDG